LAAWCRRARLFVCTDGGPRHVAAAVGARQVVLFGPTDPRHTSEHANDESPLREVVPCGPCHRERCPLTGSEEQQCMQLLWPRQVAAAIAAAWERG